MTTTTASNTNLKQDALVIGLVGVAHGLSHFFHLILAPLFPWIKEAFSLSYAELGLLMSAFFVVSGIGQALSGFVVDRVGARAVLFFGLSCLGLSALALSAAQNYPMLMAGSMLAGLGNSVFHPSDYTLLNQRVSAARLGYAYSAHGLTGNLGWFAAPLFLVPLASLAGWRTALLAAACLPFTVLAVLIAFRDTLRTDEAPKTVRGQAAVAAGGTFGFMRLPAIWMCFGFFFLNAMAFGGIQSFASTCLRQLYGMSLAWATTGFSAFMLASATGMLLGGVIAAKSKDHDKTIAIAFAAAGACSLLLATGWVNAAAAIALMAGAGFGAGIAGPSRDMLIRAAAPKNATGRVYGVVYSGLDSGLACAPALFGAVMDAHRPSWVFVAIGAFQVLAILTAVNVGFRTKRVAVAAA